ncbi:hypothetical protein GIB67_027934 [Kingdonia uniflora]|uniref:Pentatricopeptide repeat-containing protein n=1 Tax=Kingdonia uniflora TaxID=39325 RepID=A0A7J7LGH7_9MAGN|nr:hypothetical protein GIB67_027934 [Kingdonia uniflora]
MGGGMEVNKNKFIEDWGSVRENLEHNFRWTRRNFAIIGIFGIAVPYLVYKGIVKEFVMKVLNKKHPSLSFACLQLIAKSFLFMIGIPLITGFNFCTMSVNVQADCKRRRMLYLHQRILEFEGLVFTAQHPLSALMNEGHKGGCGSFGEVKRLYGRILKSGFDGESILCGQLIDVYIGLGEFECGVGVFEDMPQKRVSSRNCIIHGLTRGRLGDRRVLHLFLRMSREGGSVPDCDTFCSVSRGCSGGSVRGFEIVEQLHSQDSVSFMAMISGFSQNNLEHGALNVFIQMLKSGITPTPYAFSVVLSACAKIEFYEMGEQLHAQVYKWGLTSDTFVCNALVTMYLRVQ